MVDSEYIGAVINNLEKSKFVPGHLKTKKMCKLKLKIAFCNEICS